MLPDVWPGAQIFLPGSDNLVESRAQAPSLNIRGDHLYRNLVRVPELMSHTGRNEESLHDLHATDLKKSVLFTGRDWLQTQRVCSPSNTAYRIASPRWFLFYNKGAFAALTGYQRNNNLNKQSLYQCQAVECPPDRL